jgi:hypothetical protein
LSAIVSLLTMSAVRSEIAADMSQMGHELCGALWHQLNWPEAADTPARARSVRILSGKKKVV